MRPPRFGDPVLVHAETVRVVRRFDGRATFEHAWSARQVGRYVRHDFSGCSEWPGLALPLEWERPSRGFVLEPEDDGLAVVRLRRLAAPVPEVGVVIGFTDREEGVKRPGVDGDDRGFLAGPSRRVPLLEVALPTTSKGRIVTVHWRDVALIAAQGAA